MKLREENIFDQVYRFPEAAVKKHHKLGGLKQEKFILLKFWKLKVWNQVSAGLCPL